jgi:membrane protease YdiL (CAAX protease family)
MGLMIETIVVTVGAIAAVRLLHMTCATSIQWIAIPGVLVTAALAPAWIQKRDFPRLGLSGAATLSSSTVAVAGVCLLVFPVVFLGLWVLTRLHLSVPLRPVVPERHGWFAWLFYQFFYVAVAEEVFFRGYLQANTMRWLHQAGPWLGITPPGAAMVVSAGCFALAHVLVQGQATAGLTFLPGLVLAWLFLRTGSLLAPILFHGFANVSYAVMAMTLARP